MAQLSVFGGIDLREDGERLDAVLAQSKPTALLTYLAVARPQGFHSRDTLVALFWPEVDDRRARRSLRKVLHFLRKHLGKAVVMSRGDDVGLSAALTCDAAMFDAAVAAGRGREALELYTGEFLKGFHVSSAPQFEHWQDAESRRYRQAASRLAWSLAEGAEAADSPLEAVRLARRAHAIQPLDETGVRRLMHLLARHGDRAGALRVYEIAAERIATELGVEPARATRALREKIEVGQVRGSSPSVQSEPGESEVGSGSTGPSPSLAPGRSTGAPERVTPGGSGWRHRIIRAGLGGAVLLGLAVAAFAALRTPEDPSATDSARTVAVVPFTVAGDARDVWREDAAILLSTSIHGTAGLRARAPEYVLKLWESEFGETPPTPRDRRQIGRRIGADWIVSGSMTAANGRLRLTASAENVAAEGAAGPVVVEGARDSLFSLVDRLTVELLRDGVIADAEQALPVELSRVTTSSLPALEAYLDGEREWRSARLRDAAEAFERAVRHDSTFALASYRLAIAQYWTGSGDPFEHLGRAVRLADRLHDREATLARGWLALQEGRIEEGLDILRGMTNGHPEFGEGWLRLGDGLLHNGGRLLVPMSEFRTAMRQAIEKNPLAAEPYWHLLEDAFFREDSAEARRLVDAYRRVDPYSPACIGYVTAYELAWGDEASHASAVARLPTLSAEIRGPLNCALSVLDRAPTFRPALELVADEMESPSRPEADRRQARNNRVRLATRAGAIHEARSVLRRFYAEAGPARRRAALHILLLDVFAYPDSSMAREAARILAGDGSPAVQFWLGASALANGKPDEVTGAIASLRRTATASEADSAVQAEELARALELLRRLDEGGFVEARELFDLQLHLPGPNSGMPGSRMIPFVRELLRLRTAELLLERDRPAEALRYVESLPMDSYPSNAPATLLEGMAKEALADTVAAQAAYTRFLRWYDDADPELEPAKAKAREGLRRLGLFDH